VAQQIENLRLLESAERYRSEAEEAARRATVEGWKKYIESRTENIIGYMYDSNEVKALDKEPEPSALTLPIKVGNDTIGKLSIREVESQDDQSAEIAKAVVERLGVHIENLRLLEETKRGQIELNKRALDLAAVSEISSASTRELDIQKLLETVVHLTKERFELYHAHIYLLNETADILKLAAGAGNVGRQMVAEGWQIPVDHQDSIVARAARTRQSVIANDIVHDKDSEFLSNRLLPDTRSEMAVPLTVGDRVLGVFDVQSDRVNAFSQEDASIQTTLASQIATALQNARTFAQAQGQAQREAMLNTINQKIQSATSVEAVLQIAARELGRALGAPLTIAQLGMGAKEPVSPGGNGSNSQN
jgi:putative methionine-R-sulfoxide reductase with GAF domain